MRTLTETEFGAVVGGGPPPAPDPWDDPTGMRRPWETPGVSQPFANFSEEGGGGDGGDKGKPAQETPQERREAENQQNLEQVNDMTNVAIQICENGVKRVTRSSYECHPRPSQSQGGG